MEQRLSLITLGVADLDRARRFYERLGWHGQVVQETVFFQAGGIAVSLWAREKLSADLGIADQGDDGFGGIALAHNVRSRAEVDEILAAATDAGATITAPLPKRSTAGMRARSAIPMVTHGRSPTTPGSR